MDWMLILRAGRDLTKNKEGGFTLFELIIVLVIMGLISSLVLPRFFNSMTHVELKTAARQTIALLHQARDIAYFQKQRVKACFDLETDGVTIYRYDNKKKELKPWSVIKQYSYPGDVKIKLCRKKDKEFSQGKFDLVFSPNGNSSGGLIVLKNKKNRVYKIKIDFITGNARIIN